MSRAAKIDHAASGRAFPLPSCGACLRIAEKRGLRIGQHHQGAAIEGFTHFGGKVMALLDANGFVLPVNIDDLRVEAA